MIPQLPTNPTPAALPEWVRKAATALNTMILRANVPEVGAVRYQGGALEYWTGSAWAPVP